MEKPKPRLNKGFLAVMIVMHAAAIGLAPFYFSWKAVAIGAVLYFLTGSLGVSLGYHRLFSHRSMKARKPFEYVVAVLGSLAMQGGVISWVGTHRAHHRHTDRPGDPHSPKAGPHRDRWWGRGFFWSHFGWMLFTKMRQYDHRAKELLKQRFYRFLNRYYVHLQVAVGVLLYLIGGMPFVVYGGLLRIVVLWHTTWSINSIAHLFGYRSFRTDGDSRNNPATALITHGEAWHNNHHRFPNSAKLGLRWWEIDTTWFAIRFFRLVGLITQATVPSPAKLAAARVT